MAEVSFEVQLGSCFYGGLDCEAVYVGRKDGDSGWISVCEEHKGKAEEDGYELMKPHDSAEVDTDDDASDQGASNQGVDGQPESAEQT